MLPGFRFLFAAIALSISTLVFGLGAAALLRASHERFASLEAVTPAPTLPPPAATADAGPRDAAPPTLALLQTDPPEAAPTPVEPAAPTPVEPEKTTERDNAAAKANIPHPMEMPRPAEPSVAAIPEAEPALARVATAVPTSEATTVAPAIASLDLDAATAIAMETIPTEPLPVSAPEPAATSAAAVASSSDADVRPAPIMPTDAPIRTALLATDEPAPAASADPAAVIAGPIPLPRARQPALTRATPQARPRKRVARARPRTAPRATQRAAPPAAPAATPNPPFLFGD